MGRKATRQQRALQRERARRFEAERRHLEQQARVEQVAAEASVELPAVAPARDRRVQPDARQSRPTRVGTGRRAPGQQIACGWCGQPVVVKSRGPLPKWCSPACRHRAWEQDRAAASGRSAVAVLDRYVTAVPETGNAWVNHLGVLARQIGTGPRPIGDGELDDLAVALELAQSAIADRTRRRDREHPY